MFKKVISTALALTIILGLTACGSTVGSGTPETTTTAEAAKAATDETLEKTVEAAENAGYKIGIMTTTVSQAEEEYRVAEDLVAEYPDTVVHVTFPDNFATEMETTISTALSLASDPDMKAIIFTQSVSGTAAAIDKIREVRDDIFIWAGLPMDDNDVIAQAADVVFNTDFSTAGVQDAEILNELGVKTVLHYSFPRHLAIATKLAYHDNLKAKCEELGIAFVDVTTPDPTSDAGTTGTQQFVLEDVPKKLDEYGEMTAFYGTNLSQTEPIIKTLADRQEGYYLIIKDPSPTFYANPLGIEIPEEYAGDYDYLNKQIVEKAAEKNMTGYFTGWPLSVTNMSLRGGVQYCMEYLDGKTNGKVDIDALQTILTNLAGEGASVTLYENYENYFAVTAPNMTY